MIYKNGIFVESEHIIPRKRLSTNTYAEAMSSMIIVCSDAVIVSKKYKTIYLARRCVHPMQGYWTIGGRRFAGESGIQAVNRNLLQETGIDADEDRFNFVSIVEAIWRKRKETPTDQGKHDLIFFYSITLTEEELIQANNSLITDEYEPKSLKGFTYKDLLEQNINPIIVEIYKKIFK